MISNFADLVEKTSRGVQPAELADDLNCDKYHNMTIQEQKFNDSSKTTEQKPKSLNTSKNDLSR